MTTRRTGGRRRRRRICQSAHIMMWYSPKAVTGDKDGDASLPPIC